MATIAGISVLLSLQTRSKKRFFAKYFLYKKDFRLDNQKSLYICIEKIKND